MRRDVIVATAGMCGLAGCVETSVNEEKIGETYISAEDRNKSSSAIRSSTELTELKFYQITRNKLLSSETELQVESADAEIPRKYACRVLSLDRALDGSTQRIRLDKGKLNPYVERPTADELYNSWFDFAEEVRSEGQPVVGVSRALDKQLTSLNQAVANVIDSVREELSRETPPDVLRLSGSVVTLLGQTEVGENVDQVVDSIAGVNEALERILSLIPDIYTSARSFLEGSSETHGIPEFLKVLTVSSDTRIDYKYVMEHVFGGSPGGKLVSAFPDGINRAEMYDSNKLEALGLQGVLNHMYYFHKYVVALYQNVERLADEMSKLADGLSSLPGGQTPLIKKITTIIRGLATLLTAGAEAADEFYIWGLTWCFQNTSQVYNDVKSEFSDFQSTYSI